MSARPPLSSFVKRPPLESFVINPQQPQPETQKDSLVMSGLKTGGNALMRFLNIPSNIVGGATEATSQVARGEYQAPQTGIKLPATEAFPRGMDIGNFAHPAIVGGVRGLLGNKSVMEELPQAVGVDPNSGAGMVVGLAGEILTPDPLDAVVALKALKKVEKTGEVRKLLDGGYLPDVAKAADKIGIDLPASALTKNNFVKSTEALVQKSFFGGNTKARIVKAFDDVATKYDEITAKFVKEQDLDAIGKIIKDDLDKFADAFQLKKRELYDNVSPVIKNIEVSPDSTLEALDQMIKRKGQSFLDTGFSKQLNKLTENILNTTKITYEQLNETQKVIGAMISNFADPVAVGNKAELRKLYASIASDMDNALKIADPNAYNAIKTANKFYSDGINLLNQKVIKSVTRKSPTDLFKYLSKPGREEELKLIKRIMGPETFNEFKGSILQKIFNDSTTTKGVIDSRKLANNIGKYGEESLRKFLSPEQFAKITELQKELATIDKVSMALKSGTKVAEGSQTAFLLNSALTLGSAFSSPAVAIRYVLGQYGGAKVFELPGVQKAMTQGLEISKDAFVPAQNLFKNMIKGAGVFGQEAIEVSQPKKESSKPDIRMRQVSALQRVMDKENKQKQERKILS